MKHDEECPRPLSEFPCCSEQMCPCDREELEATMLAFNILKKENTRLKEALQAIAFGVWIEGEPQEGQYRGKQQHEIARAALLMDSVMGVQLDAKED
jgi:hypothetical protein